MEPPKRPAGKSYSEVMNEWAAQREFMGGNRSRLLHPPYDAHPVRKVLGYLGRLLVGRPRRQIHRAPDVPA